MPSNENREQSRTECVECDKPVQNVTVTFNGSSFCPETLCVAPGAQITFKQDRLKTVFITFDIFGFMQNGGVSLDRIEVPSGTQGKTVQVAPNAVYQCLFRLLAPDSGEPVTGKIIINNPVAGP